MAGDVEGRAADTSDAAPTEATPDPNRIGIVFVHGIGSQQPGETLVSWAHPLLRLISSWSATTFGVDAPNDPVLDSQIDFGGAGRPFIRASVPAQGDHLPQTWVMTEAWWATKFSPPTASDMFRWLFPTEMRRIITGILHGLGTELGGLYRFLEGIFLTIFVVPVTVLVFLVYVAFRLLRVIPLKQVQDAALLKAIDFFLTDWFGDVRVLLADRAQAANVRAAVASAIEALRTDGCGRIVVVGHSGGTIAAYMTLTDTRYQDLPVERFITHGQALALVWRLGHACAPSVPDRSVDRLYEGDRLRRSLAEARPNLHWFDFWSTHDPAPAGGFGDDCVVTTPERSGGESTRVFNRMSLRNDHLRYWENDEAFVLPVARLIEASSTGALPPTSRFFPEEPVPSRIERRTSRVKLLQYAWVGVMVSAILAVPLAILDPLTPGGQGNLAEAGRSAYGVVGWIAGMIGFAWDSLDLPVLPEAADLSYAVALVIGIAAMLTAYWAVGRVMSGLWNTWDERERAISLQPEPQWRPVRWLVIQMGLSAAAAVALLGFAASGTIQGLFVPGLAVGAAHLVRMLTPRGTVRRGVAPPDPAAGTSTIASG